MPTPPYMTADPGVEVIEVEPGQLGKAHRVTVEIYAQLVTVDTTPPPDVVTASGGKIGDPIAGDTVAPLEKQDSVLENFFTRHSNANPDFGDTGPYYYEYDAAMAAFPSLPDDAIYVSRAYRMVGRAGSGGGVDGFAHGFVGDWGNSADRFSTSALWQFFNPVWEEVISPGGTNPSQQNLRSGWSLRVWAARRRGADTPIATSDIDLYRFRYTYESGELPPPDPNLETPRRAPLRTRQRHDGLAGTPFAVRQRRTIQGTNRTRGIR